MFGKRRGPCACAGAVRSQNSSALILLTFFLLVIASSTRVDAAPTRFRLPSRARLEQNRTSMWAAATLAISILRSVLALFRSRQDQAIVELALRQQLAVYAHRHPRPRLSPLDRAFWVAFSRFWPRWRTALVVVQPETVIRWHREGFRRYWRSISVPGPGRPPISEDTQKLIVRMATENHWRARKIQAELSKLGIEVSLATISRYLPKAQTRSGVAAALDHLPAQSPRRDRRDGLLRRADRPLPAALRLVRDRPRATARSFTST